MKKKRVLALLLSAAMFVTSIPAYSSVARAADINMNKVLGLSFEGNVNDSSVKGNNGTVKGTASYVDGVNGGKAFDLDGSTYISLGKDVSLQPENLTVSFWVKAKANLVGENVIAWTKNEWNTDGWYINSASDTQAIVFSIGNDTNAVVATQPLMYATTTARNEFFPVGEWVNVTLTYDKATKVAEIYRNGIRQTTTVPFDGEGVVQGSTSEKVIGCNGAAHQYGGKANMVLDEFEVYSSVASKDEVAELYTKNGGELDTLKILEADLASLSIKTKNVTSDIVLPSEGTAGSNITWKSSNVAVISNTGVVTRPVAGSSDVTVKMTATLENGGETLQKEFTVVVSAYSDLMGMSHFDLEDVDVTDAYYSNSLQVENDYLLSLEADRLLAGFRETAGLDMKGATRYPGGWEDALIGGHTIGHYMTAVVQSIKNPDTTEADRTALTTKLNYIVDALLECQQNTKGKAGFIFGAKIIDRNNVEKQFDNVESNKTNIATQAWVPWYTMHKIIAGLVDVYNITGYENAKTAAVGLGDWTYNRTKSWKGANTLNIEYGGMNDCLYELYKITQDENHASAAHQFDETALFDRVLANESNVLNGRHANTTIPKFMGALNRYRALGENEEKYLQYAEAFWDMVMDNHSYVTGGNSEWEHFGADNVLDAERTNCNCETCNTYNMLKFTRELFKITGEKKYADYYETTLINAVMSSQNPTTGMSMYFQPMATGYFKVYGEAFNKFWCCTGTGMENFTKLNDSIYFYKDNTVFVNQYRSSVLTWEDKNVKITQTSDVLNSEKMSFVVDTIDGAAAADVNIRFRVPDWASGDVTVEIDGKSYAAKVVAGYAIVESSIANGAEIDVTIPMEIVAYNLQDATTTYAFKYGPVLLSAELGTEDMKSTVTGVNVSIPSTKKVTSETVVIDYKSGTVEQFMQGINKNLVRDGETLKFKLKNTDQTLTFSPHYMQHEQRYGIYWKFRADNEGVEAAEVLENKQKERFETAKLDTVQPGYGQYETDDLHEMIESSSVGDTSDGTSRYAEIDGNFSYRMLVSETGNTSLLCTFDRADNGKTMKITIGDTVIYNEVLAYEGDADRFYDVSIDIPKTVVDSNQETVSFNGENRKAVRIKFEGAAGEASARLFNYAYTYKTYSSNGTLSNLTASAGTLKKSNNTYTLTVPSTSKSVDLTFAIPDKYGYVAVNDKAIDETVAKSFETNDRIANYSIKAYGEDHTTYTEYTLNIVKDYAKDNTISYFVDCGDYDPSTVSAGDKLGTNNSVTEQVYGPDIVTGFNWGIYGDGTGDLTATGIQTENTWAYEFATGDGLAKTATNRYTRNQFENGIATRYLDYAFELANGTYEVEVGFANPWNCSTNPSVSANLGKPSETTISANVGVPNLGTKSVKAIVKITDGQLTINARGQGDTTKAINMTHIIIKPYVKPITVAVKGVKLNKTSTTLVVGKTTQLTATVAPANATNKAVTWKSSKISVATVSATGKVTAKKPGTVTITATTKDGSKVATCKIKVYAKTSKVSVKAAGYEASKITLVSGKKVTLKTTVTPKTAKQGVTYKSSKKSVAKVSSKGVVKARKAGKTTISVKSADGYKTKKIKVTVVKKKVANKKLSLKKTKATLKKKGSTVQIAVKSLTKKTTDKITYKVISGKKDVKVDKYGKVTVRVKPAKKSRKSVVRVKCGKVSKKFTVTIKK